MVAEWSAYGRIREKKLMQSTERLILDNFQAEFTVTLLRVLHCVLEIGRLEGIQPRRGALYPAMKTIPEWNQKSPKVPQMDEQIWQS
jgi:hypothetical protein